MLCEDSVVSVSLFANKDFMLEKIRDFFNLAKTLIKFLSSYQLNSLIKP